MPRVGWQAESRVHRFRRSPGFYPVSCIFMTDDV